MMMENIPKIAEKHIKRQNEQLNQVIVSNEIQAWLDGELQNLHDTNPILYKYLLERANKFAVAATMVGDPQSVAVSLALEYIILLNVINTSIGETLGLSKFTDMMTKWLGNGPEGLDKLGEK